MDTYLQAIAQDRAWRGELSLIHGKLELSGRAMAACAALVGKKQRARTLRSVHGELERKLRALVHDESGDAALWPVFAWMGEAWITVVSRGRIFIDDGASVSYVGTLAEALGRLHKALFTQASAP